MANIHAILNAIYRLRHFGEVSVRDDSCDVTLQIQTQTDPDNICCEGNGTNRERVHLPSCLLNIFILTLRVQPPTVLE